MTDGDCGDDAAGSLGREILRFSAIGVVVSGVDGRTVNVTLGLDLAREAPEVEVADGLGVLEAHLPRVVRRPRS